MKLKHIGCKSPVFEYIGTTLLADNPVMRANDWNYADGSPMGELYRISKTACPDCKKLIGLHESEIEPLDGSIIRSYPKNEYFHLSEKLSKSIYDFNGVINSFNLNDEYKLKAKYLIDSVFAVIERHLMDEHLKKEKLACN